MRYVINHFEEQADGTIMVEFHDAGQELTAYFHITEQAIYELIIHQRHPNRAPTGKLDAARDGFGTLPAAAVVQLWAKAHSELVQDRLDRKQHGMKAVTSHGHEDLVAVRDGAPVRDHNKDMKSQSAVHDYASRRGGF